MKTINLLTLLLCSLLSLCSCSQSMNEEDIISREKADNIIRKKLEKETNGRNYVLFSIANSNYIVIVENKDNYSEYFIKNSSDVVIGTTYDKQDKLFEKMFNTSIYKKEFITFESSFFKPKGYEMSSGNITYFVFKDKNRKRYGECRLSVLIKPNPIDSEIYVFLSKKLLNI